MLKGPEAVCGVGDPLSVIWMMKLNVPWLVGVPLMIAPFRVSPSGRAPDIVQLYGAVPPVAPRVKLYSTPTVAAGADVVEIASGAALITMLNGPDAVCGGVPPSVTCTVKLKGPCFVGVPVIVAPFRESPSGRAPEIDQLYGLVPPVAASVKEYSVPTVPVGAVVVETARGAGITVRVGFIVVLDGGVALSVTRTAS